uniref:Sulfide:quinone oxidoreductase, mitochondrial n=1 Tax=Parastrongyloides trichosuri TaxID=131310 RepID=A0A0N4Z5B3_PARTI
MKLSTVIRAKDHYNLLVLGAGAGGLATSSHFSRVLPKGSVGVVEPSSLHYYQPGFTLVGGGIFPKSHFTRAEAPLIPKNATWIKDSVGKIIPQKNIVQTTSGKEISYNFLIVATGVEIRFDLIEGLQEGLSMKDNKVVSTYSPNTVENVYKAFQNFDKGNAVFTFPNAPIKCPGAPQKICYLFEDYLRKNNKRDNANIIYNTILPRIFGIERYSEELTKYAKSKDINVNYRTALSKIDPIKRIATFDLLNEDVKPSGNTKEIEYDLLHVGPPCSPVEGLRNSIKDSDGLTDASGFIDVDKNTLQSKKYSNVFAIGDCSNFPSPKTAAAVSGHLKTIKTNIKKVMEGEKVEPSYDGYTSCPLVVSYNKCILAEFNYDGPLETTPFEQKNPSYLAFLGKKYGFPALYWKLLLTGHWNGPSTVRKVLHLNMKN